ncbi:MAG: apolipoprotein N-acyltransferase [Alphaproteobacteria bacterium]|nr:apolipoprotein N-acyltransferase [Alphaproteobacteria bacterium]
MTSLARRLRALTGWRRLAAAAFLGALAALALPPIFAVPVLFVSFTALIWLIDGADGRRATWRQALVIGWWFGLAHFAAGLYWITNSLFVDAATHGWLAPFAVLGLSTYFAVFPALVCLVSSVARPGAQRVVVFAVAWALSEWLRGMLLTGFAWNLMATTLAFDAVAIQGVALVGGYGLSLLVVGCAAAPAALAVPAGGRAGTARPMLVAAVLLALVGGAGFARISLAPALGSASTDITLRLVQGNIEQRLKWRPDLASSHFENYLRLSMDPRYGSVPDVTIWPETAVPAVLDGGGGVVRALKRAVPRDGVLITGAVRSTPRGVAPRQLWNAAVAITATGIAATYDKHHLVPFGEYVPARRLLPITKITGGRTDFSTGPGPRSLNVPGLPAFSPLVCYEVIFPGAVVAPGPRPHWLLNLTNDAWFGKSTGPYQHLAAARLRAVEEGLPLVRVANTGVSAVIDPWGRILASLAIGQRGVIQQRLPTALPVPPLFARIGNIAFGVFAAMVLAFALWLGRRKSGTILIDV